MTAKILHSAEAIHVRLNLHCRQAIRADICSYWAGNGQVAYHIMAGCRKTRVIVGGSNLESRAVQIAGALANCGGKVAYLDGCHVKLYVFHFTRPLAIIGSMNLGMGMPFEMAVEVTGEAAKEAAEHFNLLWKASRKINALDGEKVVASLAISVF